MDLASEVAAAEARIRPHVRETPLEPSPLLGEGVWLKCENLQHTGSFKFRGALNKVLSLPGDERGLVVTASTGNHGAAVARSAATVGGRAIVYVPEDADPGKLAGIRRLGAEIRPRGADCVETEAAARSFAEAEGLTYISPYNDPAVAGGQGTIAVELERQLGALDAVFVALGGGGLISGIGARLKATRPSCEVVACSPANSAVMHHSLIAGRILEMESAPTLADATAGGVEPGSITFAGCRAAVDRSLLVSEAEIAEAMRLVIGGHHLLIEGAAGVAVAAYRRVAAQYAGRRVAIVLCGANIGLEKLKRVL